MPYHAERRRVRVMELVIYNTYMRLTKVQHPLRFRWLDLKPPTPRILHEQT